MVDAGGQHDPWHEIEGDRHQQKPCVHAGGPARAGGRRGGPREVKDAPFVQIPLGVTEDRLVGTVDIEASMKVPNPQPALLGCAPWQASCAGACRPPTTGPCGALSAQQGTSSS